MVLVLTTRHVHDMGCTASNVCGVLSRPDTAIWRFGLTHMFEVDGAVANRQRACPGQTID